MPQDPKRQPEKGPATNEHATQGSNVILAAKNYALGIIEEAEGSLVYHNIKFAKQLSKRLRKLIKKNDVSPTDAEVAKISAWIAATSWCSANIFISPTGLRFNGNLNDVAVSNAHTFFSKTAYPQNKRMQVIEALARYWKADKPLSTVDKLISDAELAELSKGDIRTTMKSLYLEMEHHDVKISKVNWYETIVPLVSAMRFLTPYAQNKIQPKLDKKLAVLKKEKKSLGKRAARLFSRELNISEKEFKRLRKSLKKVKGRNERGIQTLFRTASRNQYTESQMVDTKANIMITINSIMLSLILGGAIGVLQLDGASMSTGPTVILGITNLMSAIFAILAIRPTESRGRFTEEEVREKRGSIVHFGNFHRMHPRDFEWGMLQLLNDGDYLYRSLIRELYYLGLELRRKHRLIRYSLSIFILGLGTTVATYAISYWLGTM